MLLVWTPKHGLFLVNFISVVNELWIGVMMLMFKLFMCLNQQTFEVSTIIEEIAYVIGLLRVFQLVRDVH